jgi:hypothetical protein
MAIYPFAIQKPFTGSSGAYLGGPFKIVHHTTEGSSAQGAFGAYIANRSDPHFTVDATTVYQHIDTDVAARSLRNAPGGVQTNRDSAIQIEIVGFAHRQKSRDTLQNVARLCRWIEATHGVPRVWPNGPPKPAAGGRDPGGHNRDARTWNTQGGHYGHSQVPENTHWDPGFTADEARFILEFDPADMEAREADWVTSIPSADSGLSDDTTTMPDHHHIDDMAEAGEALPSSSGPRWRTVPIPAPTQNQHGPLALALTLAGLSALGAAAYLMFGRLQGAAEEAFLLPGHAPEVEESQLSDALAHGPSWNPNDLRRQFERTAAEGWLPHFAEAARAFGFDWALLLGIASRETNIHQIVGDGGHGHGIMQIDDRYHAEFIRSGSWQDPRLNILKGAEILSGARSTIERVIGRTSRCTIGGRRVEFQVSVLTENAVERTALAAYNSGCRALYWTSQTGDPDRGTTGRDYAADTLRRAEHFRRFGGIS